MRLTHALVASDLNPGYLEFWPLVRRAWAEVAGIEAILVLIAEPADVPEALRDDPQVLAFPPLPEIHTAFQAQCIRLVYPALLAAEGAVLTADADMVPLNRRYFHRPASRIDEQHFVAYRDVLLETGEIPVCYNAALPSTWSAVFGVETIEDVRATLREWSEGIAYDGVQGGSGWVTDQKILYRTLLEYGRRARNVWILDDHYTGFRRLERGAIEKQRRLLDEDRRGIRRGAYSDFHCPPHPEFSHLNDLVVDLAAESQRESSGRSSRCGA